MLFIPYEDEQKVINMIHEVRNSDYSLLRLTPTMIGKNNIDANGVFREMLLAEDIVDYEIMENGGENGESVTALYIQADKTTPVKLKFYRVSNQRGDRRFSLQTIKRKAANGEMNVDHLLYFSTYRDENDEPIVYLINLTSNVMSCLMFIKSEIMKSVNIVSKLRILCILPRLHMKLTGVICRLSLKLKSFGLTTRLLPVNLLFLRELIGR